MNSTCEPARADAAPRSATSIGSPSTSSLPNGNRHLSSGELLDGLPGLELDSETALLSHSARSYDPTPGRWITEDVVRFAGGDSNLYRYCRTTSPAQ